MNSVGVGHTHQKRHIDGVAQDESPSCASRQVDKMSTVQKILKNGFFPYMRDGLIGLRFVRTGGWGADVLYIRGIGILTNNPYQNIAHRP